MRTVLGVIVALLTVYAQGSTDVYKTYLKEFDNVRSHVPHTPDLVTNRNNVRNFMKTKFEAAGLDVQVMNFSTTDTNTGKAAYGTNLIATLKGLNYGTSKDEVIVLAAHIDTPKRNAGGVNNDGSGLVGLVTIAEALKGKESCTARNNSIIFAAFDRTETAEIGQNVTQCKKSCGSQEFIKNKASFLKSGKIKFAIVMDCITNYEHGTSTQHLPGVLSTYFPAWYQETQLSDSIGDYLAITGRNNEKAYLDEIKKTYEAVRVDPSKGQFLAATFQWNVNGVPNSQNKTVINSAFDNGDHMSFWDANINAVLLTDTCYNRNPYRPNCDLDSSCDVLAKLKDDDFKFMDTALSTVKKITKKYTCGACAECDVNADCQGSTCTCKKGFTGNGKNCTDIDECKLNLCSKDAGCRNTQGSYQCQCKDGFTGDGKTCSATGSASVLKVIPQVLFFGVAMLLSYFWI